MKNRIMIVMFLLLFTGCTKEVPDEEVAQVLIFGAISIYFLSLLGVYLLVKKVNKEMFSLKNIKKHFTDHKILIWFPVCLFASSVLFAMTSDFGSSIIPFSRRIFQLLIGLQWATLLFASVPTFVYTGVITAITLRFAKKYTYFVPIFVSLTYIITLLISSYMGNKGLHIVAIWFWPAISSISVVSDLIL